MVKHGTNELILRLVQEQLAEGKTSAQIIQWFLYTGLRRDTGKAYMRTIKKMKKEKLEQIRLAKKAKKLAKVQVKIMVIKIKKPKRPYAKQSAYWTTRWNKDKIDG